MTWGFTDDHANESEALQDIGGAAAWYYTCGDLYCRRKEPERRKAGARLDFIPATAAYTLFADARARAHVKAILRVGLWLEVEGGYVVVGYMVKYGHTPAAPAPSAEPPPPARPTPSQLGGLARAAQASRGPAGKFQPPSSQNQPADIQPAGPAAPAPRASDPDPDPDLNPQETPSHQRPDSEARGRPNVVVVAGEPAGKVPCPSDLRLTEAQRATLLTGMVPEWAIGPLEERFVANYTADANDQRTLVVWRKCLGTFVARVWNDPNQRPRNPALGGESERDTRLRLARGPRQPNTLEYESDQAHAASIGARLE